MVAPIPPPAPPVTLTATCDTEGCPERGIAKAGTFGAVPPTIVCGTCGEPCEVTGGDPPAR
jgi:hypothetical protein